MLGEKASLKAPAVKGRRHPEATRKERRQGDHSNLILPPPLRACQHSSLAKLTGS